MNMNMPPPMDNHPNTGSSPSSNPIHHDRNTDEMSHVRMTFFWGKNVEILFSGFPGSKTGLYVVSLVVVFLMSLLVELLSAISVAISSRSSLLQTTVHTLRLGLAYLVMLSVMSFNGGVLLAVLAGHALGFFLCAFPAFRRRPEGSTEKR